MARPRSAMDDALRYVLENNSADAARTALTTVLTMVNNVLRAPDEAKFRSIKLTNATVRSKVASADGAVELLGSLGFNESEPGVLVLPLEFDLVCLALARQEIADALNSARLQPMAAPSAAAQRPKVPAAPAVLHPAVGSTVAARALEGGAPSASAFRVELLVYDLSGGAARGLSGALLGFEVDIIPHTGLLVHGIEYYFSGGVQREPPGAFSARSNLPVHQSIPLGHTEVPAAVFDEFCFELGRHRFHATSYSLLSNNCNHFTHACAEFLLGGGGIPADILHLPSRVLATPMGQMLRPMLEAMGRPLSLEHGQLTGGAPVSGGQGGVDRAQANPGHIPLLTGGPATQAGLIAPTQGRAAVAFPEPSPAVAAPSEAAGAPLFSSAQIEGMLATPVAAPSTPFPPPATPVHSAPAVRGVNGGGTGAPGNRTSLATHATSRAAAVATPSTVAPAPRLAPAPGSIHNGMLTPSHTASGRGGLPSAPVPAPPAWCYRTPMAGGPLARASCPLLACEGETAGVALRLRAAVAPFADGANGETDETGDNTGGGQRAERRALDRLVVCLSGSGASPAPAAGAAALDSPDDAAALGHFFAVMLGQLRGASLFLLLYVSRLLSPNPAFAAAWLDSSGLSRLLLLVRPPVLAESDPSAPSPAARVMGFLCASNLVAATGGLLRLASRAPSADAATLVDAALAAAGAPGPAAAHEARAAAALLQNLAISLREIGPRGAAAAPKIEPATGVRGDHTTTEAELTRLAPRVRRDAAASASVLESIRQQLLSGACAPLAAQDDPQALQRLVVCLGSLVAERLDGTAPAPPVGRPAALSPAAAEELLTRLLATKCETRPVELDAMVREVRSMVRRL